MFIGYRLLTLKSDYQLSTVNYQLSTFSASALPSAYKTARGPGAGVRYNHVRGGDSQGAASPCAAPHRWQYHAPPTDQRSYGIPIRSGSSLRKGAAQFTRSEFAEHSCCIRLFSLCRLPRWSRSSIFPLGEDGCKDFSLHLCCINCFFVDKLLLFINSYVDQRCKGTRFRRWVKRYILPKS